MVSYVAFFFFLFLFFHYMSLAGLLLVPPEGCGCEIAISYESSFITLYIKSVSLTDISRIPLLNFVYCHITKRCIYNLALFNLTLYSKTGV